MDGDVTADTLTMASLADALVPEAGSTIIGAGALEIGVATGAFNLTLSMGDALGAQQVTFTDSADATVASIDSDGNADFIGALTLGTVLAPADGGTGADLSATGGANQFVRQSGVGNAFTVSAIADDDVPNTITIDLATLASTLTVTDNEATAEANAVTFVANADLDGGSVGLESDGDFTYNPSTGTVTATVFVGSLTGNASTATALAADPADCGAGTFATTIAASGALTCASVTAGDVTADTLTFAEIADALTPEAGTSIVGGDTIGGSPQLPANAIGFGTTGIIFEGATGGAGNANEILLTAADPGADATVTIPATTGTLVTTGDSGTVSSAMLADQTYREFVSPGACIPTAAATNALAVNDNNLSLDWPDADADESIFCSVRIKNNFTSGSLTVRPVVVAAGACNARIHVDAKAYTNGEAANAALSAARLSTSRWAGTMRRRSRG